MVQSKAKNVEDYLKELPADRSELVVAVRQLVRKHLPKGYVESMRWGMICYEIPLERYSDTYNGQPLAYAAIAAQKHHCGLYLMCVYANSHHELALRRAFQNAGKKLDMGKSCVRFKRLADLELEALAKVIASTTPAEYIELYEAARKKK